MKFRFAALTLLAGCGWATDDESILGSYRIRCPGIEGSFRILNDKVSEIRVNRKKFADADLGVHGRRGSTGVYDLELSSNSFKASIQLFFLFDDVDQVRAVNGFYSEWVAKNGNLNDPKMARSCSLKIQRMKGAGDHSER